MIKGYKKITIQDFLTEAEIEQCSKLYGDVGIAEFARKCRQDIIEPNIARINAQLGQESDPMFLSYAVEYIMLSANKPGRK